MFCYIFKNRVKKDKIQEGADYDEAVTDFLRAIKLAQQQGAKSLELRAVMSLSRLWHRQGKTVQAHLRLAEIYGWFTEGFDTADLTQAKALLDEWGSHVGRVKKAKSSKV